MIRSKKGNLVMNTYINRQDSASWFCPCLKTLMKGCCEMRGHGWEMFSWETGSADVCHRASVAGRGRPLALGRRHRVFL